MTYTYKKRAEELSVLTKAIVECVVEKFVLEKRLEALKLQLPNVMSCTTCRNGLNTQLISPCPSCCGMPRTTWEHELGITAMIKALYTGHEERFGSYG